MSYSLDEAKAAVVALTSTGDALKQDLLAILKQVSVAGDSTKVNPVTLLYSGPMGNLSLGDAMKYKRISVLSDYRKKS